MAHATVRHYAPRIYVPGTKRLLLTEARKMPCNSWSLPAGKACPFKLYGEGTICGDCYAQKGSYTCYPNVARAQNARFDWTVQCMRTEAGTAEFISLMVQAITAATRTTDYFRVHDSGDLFSPAYTWAWVAIAQRLPNVRFWIPTRSWRPMTMTRISPSVKAEWTLALMALSALENVTLRPSALMFNAPAPRIPGLSAGSTATSEGFNCPASTQDNSCGDCRACWTETETPISYHRH